MDRETSPLVIGSAWVIPPMVTQRCWSCNQYDTSLVACWKDEDDDMAMEMRGRVMRAFFDEGGVSLIV